MLEHLASGLTDRQIAEALSISPTTVRSHITRILGKLGASPRTPTARARVGTS